MLEIKRYFLANDNSNQYNCKIKEIIKKFSIVAKVLRTTNFQVSLQYNQKYTSNIVKLNNMKEKIFLAVYDINIAINELKNIIKHFNGDIEKAEADIKDLNQCYQSQYEYGNSIFHDMIYKDEFSNVKCILECSSNLIHKIKNNYGEGLLHCAFLANKIECIEPLMELGCSLSQQDDSKSTPLHLAIEYRANETIRFFQEILINSQKFTVQIEEALRVYNLQGHTPLHLAVLNDLQDLVLAILRYCKATNKLHLCRMEVLGGGARILHLAKSKNFQILWELIVEELPEAVYFTDYAGRTSTTIDLPEHTKLKNRRKKRKKSNKRIKRL